MKRLVVLLGLVALAAGCGGSGVPVPKESAGVFVTRILREELHGQWAPTAAGHGSSATAS